MAATSIRTDLLIGGTWRPAGDGARIDVLDPATGDALAAVADASPEDALAAVDAAAAAAPAWAATAPRERAEVLRRGFELMRAREDEIAATITAEMGKPLAEARGEAAYAAEFLRWFAEEAVRAEGEYAIAPGGAARILVLPQPVGISVLVTPWNFPAAMATRKLGPALAAGCTAIVKPATETPLTTLLIVSLLEEAGLPPGVVGVLTTSRPRQVVATMVDDPRVRKLSFTGSTEVGRELLALAARSVVNVSMELGGNAPFLVLEDADVDAAVAGAMAAKLRNGGEACTAANRFLVHESARRALRGRPGGGDGARCASAPGTRAGRRARPDDQRGRRRARSTRWSPTRATAEPASARAASGSTAPAGSIPPTVLDRVAPGSAILRDEVFGPVAPLTTFTDEDDAIATANDTEHGLVAYVFSRDLRRAMRVGEALETGMVGLNRGVVSDPAAPFGGVKQSGVGREGGGHGLREFLEPKYFSFD